MPRCLSEGVDIFLKSAERQGGANRTFATGGRCHGWQLEPCPYELEPLYHFSLENSHPETRHQGVMFRSPWAFVGGTTTLRYEPCTQFINVSQRALHIYFIDGCRRIKIERNNLLCEQAPTEVFRSIFAWLVAFNLLVFILILRMEICEGGAVRQLPEHPGVDPNEKRNGYRG